MTHQNLVHIRQLDRADTARRLLAIDRTGLGLLAAPLARASIVIQRFRERVAVALLTVLTATGLVEGQSVVQSVQKLTTGHGGFSAQLNQFDGFGAGAAAIGDPNNDGYPDFVVSAFVQNSGPIFPGLGDQVGVLHVISLDTTGSVIMQSTIDAYQVGFTVPADGFIHMGHTVEPIGDLDGNGVIDIAVAATWRQGSAASPLQAGRRHRYRRVSSIR